MRKRKSNARTLTTTLTPLHYCENCRGIFATASLEYADVLDVLIPLAPFGNLICLVHICVGVAVVSYAFYYCICIGYF